MASSDKPTLFHEGQVSHEALKDRSPSPSDFDDNSVVADRRDMCIGMLVCDLSNGAVWKLSTDNSPKADIWLLHFKRFADFHQMRAAEITAAFPLFLRDNAI